MPPDGSSGPFSIVGLMFLTGEERSARYEDEQRLIRFVVFLHQIMGRSIGGIRQRLSAICPHHCQLPRPTHRETPVCGLL